MLEQILKQLFIDAFVKLYGKEPSSQQLSFQKTRPEFEGDVTVVVFPFVKTAGKAPDVLAKELGDEMMRESEMIAKFNVVKGFLNLVISVIGCHSWRIIILMIISVEKRSRGNQ